MLKKVLSRKRNANGSIRYFYYWHFDSKALNNEGNAAVLFHLDGWHTSLLFAAYVAGSLRIKNNSLSYRGNAVEESAAL